MPSVKHLKACFILLFFCLAIFVILITTTSCHKDYFENVPNPFEMAYQLRISIIVVITSNNTKLYKRALDSLQCYSQIHNYKFLIVQDTIYKDQCKHKDKFFRRHCVVATFLDDCDYMLFIDGDVGVVNPNITIESFIDPRYDVTLYNRFFNHEIAAGGYLLKNTQYAMDFIRDFANYESKLPKSFTAHDNGALHAFILQKLFPDRPEEYQTCLELYNKSKNHDWLYTYEACVQMILGIEEGVKNIRILQKAKGWARDNWLTNSLWHPDRDFMIHGWKSNQLLKYKPTDLPIKFVFNFFFPKSFRPTHKTWSNWYDPLVGEFDFEKCVTGNTTWNYDSNLIASVKVLHEAMSNYWMEINRKKLINLASIPKKMNWTK